MLFKTLPQGTCLPCIVTTARQSSSGLAFASAAAPSEGIKLLQVVSVVKYLFFGFHMIIL